jgi:lipopolysaccharide/colanic/teichoic acid biosynthesis glycosyltransferase
MNEEFKAPRASSRVHLRLAFWVIKNKIDASAKRVFDLVFASTALFFLSPVFLATAIAIKVDSPGPVFFKQTRVGKRGKLFGCYKFRSICGSRKQLAELMALNEAVEIVLIMSTIRE